MNVVERFVLGAIMGFLFLLSLQVGEIIQLLKDAQ